MDNKKYPVILKNLFNQKSKMAGSAKMLSSNSQK